MSGGPPSAKHNLNGNAQNYWVKSQSLTENKQSTAAAAAASMFADARGQTKMNVNLSQHQQQMPMQHKISQSAGLVQHQRSERNLPEIKVNPGQPVNASQNVWQNKGSTPQSQIGGVKTAPEQHNAPPNHQTHSDAISLPGASGTGQSWKVQQTTKPNSTNIPSSHFDDGKNGSVIKNYRQMSRELNQGDGMVTPTLNNKYKLFSTAANDNVIQPNLSQTQNTNLKQPYRISALNIANNEQQSNTTGSGKNRRVNHGASLTAESKQVFQANEQNNNGQNQIVSPDGQQLPLPQYIQLKDFRHQHPSSGVIPAQQNVGSGIGNGQTNSQTQSNGINQSPKNNNSFDVRYLKNQKPEQIRSKQTFETSGKQDSRMRRLQNVETKFDRVSSGNGGGGGGSTIPSTLGATGQALTGAPSMLVGHERRRFFQQGLDTNNGPSPYQFSLGRNPIGSIMISGQRTGTNQNTGQVGDVIGISMQGRAAAGGNGQSNSVVTNQSNQMQFQGGSHPFSNQQQSWLMSKSGAKLSYFQQQQNLKNPESIGGTTNSQTGNSSYAAFSQSMQGNLINRQAKQRMITSNNSSISQPQTGQINYMQLNTETTNGSIPDMRNQDQGRMRSLGVPGNPNLTNQAQVLKQGTQPMSQNSSQAKMIGQTFRTSQQPTQMTQSTEENLKQSLLQPTNSIEDTLGVIAAAGVKGVKATPLDIAFSNQNNQQQISSTLFIMDCQTFGIFNNQKLLKLSNIKAQQASQGQPTGGPNDTHTPQYQYTEAQIVNFVMNRALTSQQQAIQQQQQHAQDPKAAQTYQQQQLMMIPKELPKLSEDSKRILTTIKAQQHLTNILLQESQKLDTLIIELDYYDYKNQLLQQLFHHYGNRVLSNLVHKITSPDDPPNFQNFQRVEDYVEKVRKIQEDRINQRNAYQQKLFSQINDLSSGNEMDRPAFQSVDGAPEEQAMDEHKKSQGGLHTPNLNEGRADRIQTPEDDKEDDEVSESDLQNYAEEIQHLFPKYAVHDRGHMREIQLDQNDKDKKEPEPGKEKKIKKLNFHVIVKNTRLYHALRFVEAYKRLKKAKKEEEEEEGNDTERESSKVVMGAAATMSQYGNSDAMTQSSVQEALSTFVLVNDCSMLKFALYCFHVGIVNSVQQMMRQFFKHVFIVIKPGKKQLPDGSVQFLRELPQVDVDKINKYLIQTKIRKSMQHSAAVNAGMKNGDQRRLSQMAHQQDSQGSPIGRSGRGDLQGSCKKGYYSGQPYSANGPNNGGSYNTFKRGNRYDSKTGNLIANPAGPAERDMVRVSSLNSFKSLQDVCANKQKYITEYWHHFNSGPSNIKVEGHATKEASTILIIHKPFTHLDNSRIQKAFKIYNEFTQLIFKSKLQTILHLPETSSQYNKEYFSKAEFNRVYKLAGHMGIKLPRKSYSTAIGRQPLIEMLKNHRQVALIKEQMIRFTHRILNEENDLSQNFQACVLAGTTQTVLDKGVNSVQSPNKSTVQAGETLPQAASDFLNNTKNRKQPPTAIVCQQTPFYKYQIGFGNNHYLIKALMKQRPWLHQLQRDKNSMMNGIIKLDFDESSILWTQWRRPRVYDSMSMKTGFDDEFKQLLNIIGPMRRLYPVVNQPNCLLLNYDGAKPKKVAEESKDRNGTSALDDTKQTNRKQSIKKKEAKVQEPQPQKAVEVRGSKSLKNSSKLSNEREKAGSPQKGTSNMNIDEDGEEDEKKKEELNLPSLVEVRNLLDRCKRRFQRIYNRLEFNQHLNNKKALFLNMRNYYNYCCGNQKDITAGAEDMAATGENTGQHVFDTLPLTFHIKSGLTDPEFGRFEDYYNREARKVAATKHRKNIWIIKPGENSNRGVGIRVEQDLSKIRSQVSSYCSGDRSMIVQKYIDNPLLYQRRKFDIRCFSLVTCINGVIKAYFYRDGYLRTASREYSMNNLQNKFIHLVNDAVQKYSEDYGKYEPGNKLGYGAFQKYLTQTYPDKKIHFERDIMVQIKKIVTDTVRATFHLLDSKRRLNSYELFGYDFMFDDNFKPFLIEVNSNPSLEPSSNLLTKLFTQMLDNTFRIACDPLCPPQEGFSMKKGSIGVDIVPENRFDIIFDERVDGAELLQKFSLIGQKEREEIEDINELEGSECGDDDDNEQVEDKEQEIKANEAVVGVMAEAAAEVQETKEFAQTDDVFDNQDEEIEEEQNEEEEKKYEAEEDS